MNQGSPAVVIGYGSIGKRHARALASLGTSLAIVNRGEAVRAKAAEDHPSARIAARLEDLDAAGFPWRSAVAVIATWAPSHADFFHALADRGVLSILCEKLMASSVASAQGMVARAERDGIALGVKPHVPLRGARTCTALPGRRKRPGRAGVPRRRSGSRVSGHKRRPLDRLRDGALRRSPDAGGGHGAGPADQPSVARPHAVRRNGDLELRRAEGGGPLAQQSLEHSAAGADRLSGRRHRGDACDWRNGSALARSCFSAPTPAPANRVSRTAPVSETVFDGQPFGTRGFNEGLQVAAEELLSGDMRTCSGRRGMDSVSTTLGALIAGRNGHAVDLPIHPESTFGLESWPVS